MSVLSISRGLCAIALVTAFGCAGDLGDLTQDLQQTSQAVGVTGPAFYVDGTLYRTVGTPTTLPDTAPADSFDTIYAIGEQTNVANAAPGDADYNGGRWEVHAVSFADYDAAVATHDENGSGDFDSVEELHSAFAAGDASDDGIVTRFECPVIPVPRSGR